MKGIRAILILFFGIFPALMNGHNPNEVQYDFKLSSNVPTLEIHLTPITLVNLVKHLYPELKDAKTIKLEDYVNDFEAYFNSTVLLKTEGKTFQYKLMSHNLYDHDALLNFNIKTTSKDINSFDLTLTSFTKVYKRISNVVTLKSQQIDTHFNLSANRKHFSYEKGNRFSIKQDILQVSLWIGLSVFFSFFIFRLKRP